MLNVDFKRSQPLLSKVCTFDYDALHVVSEEELLIEVPIVRDPYLCCSRNRCHLVTTLLVIYVLLLFTTYRGSCYHSLYLADVVVI